MANGAWSKPGSWVVYAEKKFSDRTVGHVVQVEGTWKAFLNGTYLGSSPLESAAMILVEEHERRISQ